MISTNIDGTSNASSQLFDLLTLVANPAAYQDKIAALEAATAENKKYVELVGPASDILRLKEVAKADAESAKAVLADANVKAEQLVNEAKSQAATITSEAQAKADGVVAQANAMMADANKATAQASQALREVSVAEAAAKAKMDEAVRREASAKLAEDAALQAKADAEQTKAAIIAKHQAFIQGL